MYYLSQKGEGTTRRDFVKQAAVDLAGLPAMGSLIAPRASSAADHHKNRQALHYVRLPPVRVRGHGNAFQVLVANRGGRLGAKKRFILSARRIESCMLRLL